MFSPLLPLLLGTLLTGTPAPVPVPVNEVQALITRLNELVRVPQPEQRNEVLVSLANCGIKQTVRVFRKADETSTGNINVSSAKNGSSWGIKSDDKVQLEISLALEWAEVAGMSHTAKQDEKTGRRYYDLNIKRRPAANGKTSSRLTDTITLALYTEDEKEVADLERRLSAVRQQCLRQPAK